MDLPFQIRQNAVEYQDFLKDLSSWENQIKQKERQIKGQKQEIKTVPVRSSANVKKEDRIKSSDYRSWDKLNVDKMLEEMDEVAEVVVEEPRHSSDDKIAEEEKRLGNEQFKQGNYEKSIEHYTNALAFNKVSVYYSNRAASYLKLKKFNSCIDDCAEATKLDKRNIKAYYRSALAKAELGMHAEAVKDYQTALVYEPSNKEIAADLAKSQALLKQALPVRRRLNIRELNKPAIEEVNIEKQPTDNKIPENKKPSIEVVEEAEDSENGDLMEIVPETDNSTSLVNESVNVEIESQPAEKQKPNLKVPSTPTSNFEFERDWKTVASNPELMWAYLNSIPKEDVVKIIKSSLDSKMFSAILKSLSYASADDAISFMNQLSKVARFSMNLMFLSKSEKNELNELLKRLDNGSEEYKVITRSYK